MGNAPERRSEQLIVMVDAALAARLQRVCESARRHGRRLDTDAIVAGALERMLDETEETYARLDRVRAHQNAATGEPIVMGSTPEAEASPGTGALARRTPRELLPVEGADAVRTR